MSARDLIDAIDTGNSTGFQKHFEEQLAMRIAARLDERRKEVARQMFTAELGEAMAGAATPAKPAADKPVHPNAIHVQHVGGGKYKVHAVGKNWSDGIKAGEHLNDSELDDFAEMGGKIKHMK